MEAGSLSCEATVPERLGWWPAWPYGLHVLKLTETVTFERATAISLSRAVAKTVATNPGDDSTSGRVSQQV